MADSDDEYDRKRRDKFRGERTESYSRERRDDRRRDDWVDRYLHIYLESLLSCSDYFVSDK